MNDLIIITGPTASGKTTLSFDIAEKYPIEIISADSRQVFKHLNIGTAKPNEKELNKVKHHFIDIVKPDSYYSAGKFGEEANNLAKNIIARGKVPLVVGGSGLYIKALIEGLFDEKPSEELLNIRKKLEQNIFQHGKEYLLNELKLLDPESYNKYEDQNSRRVVRALSYYRLNGKPISEAKESQKQDRHWRPHYFAINHSRDVLYQRINNRTNIMWEIGFEDEVKNILDMGYSKELNSLDSVGYKECIAYLNSEITKDEAISEMQKFTRRFAKRQITWIRNQSPETIWLEPNNNSRSIELIDKIIQNSY